MGQQGHEDAVIHRYLGIDAGDLKRAGDPQPAPAIGREFGDVFALEKHLARVREVIAGDQFKLGGFAGPVGPDDGMDVPWAHGQTDTVGGHQFSEYFDYFFSFQNHGPITLAGFYFDDFPVFP